VSDARPAGLAWRRRLAPHQWLLLATGAVALLLLLWGAPDRAIATAIEGFDRSLRDGAGWIAELGDSKWYLYPAGAVLVLAIVARRWVSGRSARAAWDWLIGAVGFLVLALGLSGIVVNLAKWSIGRARPNLFTREDLYTFQPFTFDARFHSFPSGHVNTLIALGLTAGFFLPRLRLPLIALATLLALTRVAENAHYLGDFFGGAAVAIATTYWLRTRFAERGWVFSAGAGAPRINRRGRMLGRWLRRRLARRRRAGDSGREIARLPTSPAQSPGASEQ
jgi:membrane-associated phospholipid phosphatase